MNIVIIGFTKIKYHPYLNLYLNNIDIKKHDISVIYWMRDFGSDTSLPNEVTAYPFKYRQDDDVPKIKKIIGFILFRKYALSILDGKKFDKIILLSTYPAVLLSGYLLKHYKGQYIFDYRDVTLETISFFRRYIAGLVKNAEVTFVSSRGFLKYLPPNGRYLLTHNIDKNLVNCDLEINSKKRMTLPLRVRIWGFSFYSDVKTQMQIVKQLCNDSRFELHYHGREQGKAQALKDYCSEIKAKNIFFHGEYAPADKLEFIKETDLVFNYQYSSAMSNRYYDALIIKLPQICSPNSLMGECVTEFGIGFAADPCSENYNESIFSYYNNLDWDDLHRNCKTVLSSVIDELTRVEEYIKTIGFKQEKSSA